MNSPHKSPIESISEAEWATLPSNVQTVGRGLVDESRQLKLTIAKLEEQVRRNSQNSSQPSSQDTAEPKPVQEAGVRSARGRGGQPGHVGRGRALVPVEAVDELVIHRPVACENCGALVMGEDPAPYRHQITEVPTGKARVTEHQVQSVMGLCCGTLNRATLPPEVAASQFGPNLVSLLAVWMGCYRLSKRQVVALLETCFGVSVAASSVVNQQQVVSAALAEPVEERQAYVKAQPTCNVDETGWRQGELAKTSWLWVVVTTFVTVFHIEPSRRGAVARLLLGET